MRAMSCGCRSNLCVAFLGLAMAVPCLGQSVKLMERDRIQARIAELEARLNPASSNGRDSTYDELRELRGRLIEGDFRGGDIVAIIVEGEEALTDTFEVRPPRHLHLPNMEPIDLTGVLSDELEPYMRAELRRYLREPVVTAYRLTRLGVFGAVKSPGYYVFRSDTRVTDVFGAAGGLQGDAQIDDIVIRRQGQTVVEKDVLSRAMSEGWDLDRLPYRPGDNVFVPAGSGMNARDWVLVVSGVVGITVTIARLAGGI